MRTPRFTFQITFLNDKNEELKTIIKKWRGYDTFDVLQWAEDEVLNSNGKYSYFNAYDLYPPSMQK